MPKPKNKITTCIYCMKKHEMQNVRMLCRISFKGTMVDYWGDYCYCDKQCACYADEDMLSRNDLAMKDAYRSKMGLLTSSEIASVRKKCGISSEELNLILGWDAKTVEEYEGHRVQSAAHDEILRKFSADPDIFLSRPSAKGNPG